MKVEKKINRGKIQLFYFSFICKTPIELNNPIAITGIHTAKDKEILFVWPKANDKSLK